MKRVKRVNRKPVVALIFSLVITIAGFPGESRPLKGGAQPKPEILITLIPHSGPGGEEPIEQIAGVVKDVDFRAHKVVVYAFAGNQWWVQPTAASPKTSINNKGEWETDTHLGRQYAALLVTDSFKPRPISSELPTPERDKGVVASDIVPGRR